MADTVPARIRIVYPISFVPLRGTKPKEIAVADTVEVDIPAVTSSEAPLAFDAFGSHSRYQGRTFGGKLYMPAVIQGLSRMLSAPMPFQGLPMDALQATALLYPGYGHQDLKLLANRKTVERPTGLTRVIHDGYEEVRKITLDALDGLLLVDGGLHRRAAPPVYAFTARNDGEWGLEIVDGTTWFEAHYAFGLDRMDDAAAFRERVVERGGMRIDEMSRVQVGEFDRAAVAIDEAGQNASYAVSQVLSSFGRHLDTHSPDLIRISMEMSRARGGFRGPAKDPAGVHAAIGELLDAIPENDKSSLRRHAVNAMDAISSARDFEPAPIGLTP